jgi:SPW repeat
VPFVRRWMVPIVLAIGVWEVVSPYVLSFSGGPLVNAVITGVVVVVLALWALRIPSAALPRWLVLVAGMWLALSPFVLKFSHTAGTTVSSVIVGIALIVLGAYWGLQRAGRGSSVEDRSRRMV